VDIVAELAAQSRDLESVLAEMAEALHRMGLVQAVPEYSDPERADWASIRALAERLSREDVQLYYEIAVHGRRDLGLAPDPRTGLEMSLLRMLAFRPVASAGAKGQAGPGTRTVETKAPTAARPIAKQAMAARATAGTVVAATPKPPLKAEAVGADSDWQDLLVRLQFSGPVRELARNITLESRSGSKWRFLIPDAVSHLGSNAVLDRLRQELSTQLGQPVELALRTAKEALMTPARVSEQAEVKRLSEAERAISNDPTVRKLKERFGARVVDDSIQPLQ